MRFYKFCFTSKEVNKVTGEVTMSVGTEWFGSERDAVVRRMGMWKSGELAGKKSDHDIEIVEVPTRKEDLLIWLNENVKDLC